MEATLRLVIPSSPKEWRQLCASSSLFSSKNGGNSAPHYPSFLRYESRVHPMYTWGMRAGCTLCTPRVWEVHQAITPRVWEVHQAIHHPGYVGRIPVYTPPRVCRRDTPCIYTTRVCRRVYTLLYAHPVPLWVYPSSAVPRCTCTSVHRYDVAGWRCSGLKTGINPGWEPLRILSSPRVWEESGQCCAWLLRSSYG